MTQGYEALLKKAEDMGAEARLIASGQVFFDPRSFLKCRFGCNRWGRFWTCPPNLDISYEQFQEAYNLYSHVLVLKTSDPQKGQEVALAMEKEAMLEFGSSFAFALVLCVQCEECAYPDPCRYPHLARPSADAYGIDIGKTLEPLGFNLEFDPEGKLLPAWYAMVLLG